MNLKIDIGHKTVFIDAASSSHFVEALNQLLLDVGAKQSNGWNKRGPFTPFDLELRLIDAPSESAE